MIARRCIEALNREFDLSFALTAFRRAVVEDVFDFDGRLERREFWNVIAVCFAAIAVSALPGFLFPALIYLPLIAALSLTPVLASAGVRRMHDVARSGFWFAAPIWNVILALKRGGIDSNRFGPAPDGERLDNFL